MSKKHDARMNIIPSSPIGYTWEDLMRLALIEARKATHEDEVPVGALIVTEEGEILAKAYNQTRSMKDPSAHAEVLALRRACAHVDNFRLDKSYLVVTFEPCIMCLGVAREARVSGIIFGAYDYEVGAVCSYIEGAELNLKSPKPWFMGGILEEECKELLQDFFKDKR